MRWKIGVEIIRDGGLWLRLNDKRKKIKKEDIDILKLMEAGVVDDDELVSRVARLTNSDAISTGFRLAQFVEDYGDFIAEARKSSVFGL